MQSFHSFTPAVKATPNPNTCEGVNCTYWSFTNIFCACGDIKNAE